MSYNERQVNLSMDRKNHKYNKEKLQWNPKTLVRSEKPNTMIRKIMRVHGLAMWDM